MLDADALIAAAREETGLADFGPTEFEEGLRVLVKALNEEAKLSERGMGMVGQSIQATLANRLRVEDYLACHPQLLEAPIEKPLFLFGLPRTGTTLAINLLTSDPARRWYMRWEAFNTVPPAEPGALRTDPRCIAEQAKLETSKQYVPHIAAMHWEDADSSTECQFAMTPSFCSQVYESQFDIPGYSAWFHEADYRPAFRYHKRLMQLLQGNNPGRWTFKNPWHPLYLESLVEIYPDAQLAMTHRDPADVVASTCSLGKAVRELYSDSVDPKRIAEQKLRTFDTMIERLKAFEDKRPGSVHHIQYKALTSDPIGEMKRLYAANGEPLTAEAEAAMQEMLAANPKGKHGKHEYRLEDYGLTREQVHEHFADYIDRYEVEVRR